MWHSCMIEYYLVIKMSEVLIHNAARWALKTVCQVHKAIAEDHTLRDSVTWDVQYRQIHRVGESQMLSRAWCWQWWWWRLREKNGVDSSCFRQDFSFQTLGQNYICKWIWWNLVSSISWSWGEFRWGWG